MEKSSLSENVRVSRIKELLKDKGLKQKDLAEMIEVRSKDGEILTMEPQNLSRCLTSGKVSEKLCKKIIEAFPDYNLEWLLGYSDLKTQEEKDRADLEWCNDILEKHNRQAEAVWCLLDGALNKSGLSLKFCHRSGQHLDSHERFKKECYYSIVDESGNEVKRLTAEEQFRLERKIQRICEILTDDLLNPVSIFS